MNIVIAHHHLGPGGVTKVVANHILAIDAADEGPVRVGLIFDGEESGLPPLGQLKNVEVVRLPVPSVGYSDAVDPNPVVGEIITAIESAGFDDAPIHVHNHSLGKNVAFSGAIRNLADRGWPLLLQCHDFAEDYRPANYRRLASALGNRLAETLYYHGPQVHLAALNARDIDALRTVGVPRERLHFLPNPVPPPPELANRDAARSKLKSRFGIDEAAAYWLYPVRGIRRKNLGELVLLAAAGRGRVTPAVTLAPQNENERPFYAHWRAITEELSLPARFGVGEGGGLAIEENLAAADRVVTTSVAEGFGMVFLEPWLAQRPLVGRDLPEITSDFREGGLDLSDLSPRIDVPSEVVGERAYLDRLYAAATKLAMDYSREPPSHADVERSFERRVRDSHIDFGDLDEELQSRVIRAVADDGMLADSIFSQWPDGITSDVASNAEVVATRYDLASTGQRLLSIYHEISDADYDDVVAADGNSLLNEFQSIDRLRLIRA